MLGPLSPPPSTIGSVRMSFVPYGWLLSVRGILARSTFYMFVIGYGLSALVSWFGSAMLSQNICWSCISIWSSISICLANRLGSSKVQHSLNYMNLFML